MKVRYLTESALYTLKESFDTFLPQPDSLFTLHATRATHPNAHRSLRREWNARRPVELTLA